MTDVREDIIPRLVAASTTAGGRVDNSRVRPYTVGGPIEGGERAVTVDEFPRINVATRRLRRDPVGQRAKYMTETCEIVIMCLATGALTAAANVVEAADTLEQAVFDALRNDGSWLARFTEPPRLLSVDTSQSEGSTLLVCHTQVWEVKSRTERTAPQNADDLSTVVATLTDTPRPAAVAREDDLET